MKIIAAGSDTFSQLMRLKIKFILVICFISFIFFPLIAIAQDIIIFEDDFLMLV